MLAPTDLLGEWQLYRRVHDRRAGVFGSMSGTLTLSPGDDGVRWVEAGRFSFARHTFDSSRTLLVVTDGPGWTVCFDDGRPFHPWAPGNVVEHPCRADTYRGLVSAQPSLLRVLWDVTGPAKDQRLLTRCTR